MASFFSSPSFAVTNLIKSSFLDFDLTEFPFAINQDLRLSILAFFRFPDFASSGISNSLGTLGLLGVPESRDLPDDLSEIEYIVKCQLC